MTEIDAETRYLLRFKTGTYDEYESIALKDPFTLYFTYDTQQLFRGDKEYTKSAEIVDELPETGISGKMYIVSGEDKSSLYFWNRNNNNYKRISDLYKERNVVFVTEVPEFENSRQETLYVYTDGDNNTHIYYKGEESMIDALKIDQTYSATSTNAQSGIAVAKALKTINVKDLEQAPTKPVDKWEYNKFYKNVETENFVDHQYFFGDGTSSSIGSLLPISIVVKYKKKLTTSSGEYIHDIIYNFDGRQVRTVIIDPVNKTIKRNSFIPIDGSKVITEINETATNNQYPTALAVKNFVNASIEGSQIQVDWEQNDDTKIDYIKNKPFYEETIDTTHFFVEDKEVEVDPEYPDEPGNMHWDSAKFTELTVGELYDVKFKLTKADGSYKEVIYTGIECVDTAHLNDVEGGICPSLMSLPEGLPADYYPPAINYHSNTDNLYFMLVNNVGGGGPFSYDDTKCQYCVEVYTELPSAESSGTIDSELTIHFSIYQGGTSHVGRSDKYLNVLQSDFESSDDTTTNYIRNKPFDIKETVSSKTIELVHSESPISVEGKLGLEQGQKVHFKYGNYEFDANVGSFDIFHNAIQVSDDVNGIALALIDGQDENGNDFDGYIYSCVTNDNQPVTAELTIRTKETIFNTKYKSIFQADFNETDTNKPSYIKNRPAYEETVSLPYTRLKYDLSAWKVGDNSRWQVRSPKLGLEAGVSYTVRTVIQDTNTGETNVRTTSGVAERLTRDVSTQGITIPAGAIELITGGAHIAFMYDGIVYNDLNNTFSLGDGCIHQYMEDTSMYSQEYQIVDIPSEEVVTHKLPSRFIQCGSYLPVSPDPQSGIAVQEAVLSVIPKVPSSLGDGHVKVVVTDDGSSPTLKSVSIYSEGIGHNYDLRTGLPRDTLVGAINTVYDSTVNNETNISQNTRNITKNTQDISKNTKDLSDRGQDITSDAFKKTVEGTRLEITDISPVSHKLEVSVTPAKSKNLIRFPRSELVSSSFQGTCTYYLDGRIKVVFGKYSGKGDIFNMHLRNSRGMTAPDGGDPLPAGDYTIRLDVLSVSPEGIPLPYIFVDKGSGDTLRLEANTDHVLHIEDNNNWVFRVHWDPRDYVAQTPTAIMSVVLCEGTSSIPYTPPMLLESMLGNIYVSSKGGEEEISTKRSNKSGFVVGLPSYFPITKLTSYISDTQDSSRHHKDVAQIRCTYLQSVSGKISSLEEQIRQLSGSLDEVLTTIGGAE